ncbi:MAG TPA: carboxypeptidase-like regulatory domain-containing protein [Vicinamibacterales bacterium]|nr:carboxypeptidase-like regulatory domain-containing protein [Vicinamibacterales bacterium]
MTARRFTVATSDGRARVDVAFELRCGDSTLWAWTIPSLPARPVELFHPEADCLLRAKAAGYRESERKLTKPDLGTIHLQRLPVLSGTITDATTAIPIRGAEILLPDGKRLALSDASGRFAVPVEPWPRALRVEADGYAARTIDVPKAIADADLRIALSSGGSVTLVLEPPLGKEPVRWELRRVGSGGKSELTRSGAMAAGQTEFTVDRLDPGTYHIVVMGDSPWQRFGMPVQVSDRTTSQALVRIEPAVVDLDVRFDGQPLEGATVDLRPEGGEWKAEARTDREGRIVEEIWQRGSFHLYVFSPPLVDIWRDEARADDDGTVRWTVSIPNRKVRGRVIDEETGQPISQADVLMQLTDARRNGMAVPTSTAADGSFEFKALPIGAYRLEVVKPGYETLRTPSFALTEFTTVDDRNVALRRVSGRTIRVVNAHGAPIESAAVYVSTRSGTRLVGGLDANGRLTLPIADASSGTIFVLPSSGSIGIARLDSHQKSGVDESSSRFPTGWLRSRCWLVRRRTRR